jgi:hypothetical protein
MPHPSRSPPKFQEATDRKPLSANSQKTRLNLSDISRISVEEIYDQIFMDSKPTPTFSHGFGPSAVMKRAKEIMMQQEHERGRSTRKDYGLQQQRRTSSSGVGGGGGRNRSASARSRSASADGRRGHKAASVSLIDMDYEDIERMRNWSAMLRR